MNHHIHFFFQQGEQGWSEDWWGPNNLPGSPAVYLERALDVAALRVNMLANLCFLRVVRITDPENPRISAHSYKFSDTRNTVAGAQERDVAGTAARFLAWSNDRRYRRNVWIRGLPDNWIRYDANGLPVEVEQFKSAADAYFGAVKERGWTIRSVNKELPPNGPATQTVVSIGPDVLSGLTRVEVIAHGYVDGDKVRISKARFRGGQSFVNRVWEVILPTLTGSDPTNSFLINNKLPLALFGEYIGGGTVRLRTPKFSPVSIVDFVEDTAHKVGRVSYTRRGRSRRRGASRAEIVSDTMGPPPALRG